eukprot:CAMPEP_0177764982 /NCGR_PEP_ID=MMETSP0491_2-20121128/7739_1 /TAXON_ID=63592 /ORGANISM="Tetraselmis chuii, Strain PLY429" /LENGTH=142 /DNA_ID=CAMNT_0019281281 /DNA_START=310 /DNA_END=738 /DNA_ORIENTATION=+
MAPHTASFRLPPLLAPFRCCLRLLSELGSAPSPSHSRLGTCPCQAGLAVSSRTSEDDPGGRMALEVVQGVSGSASMPASAAIPRNICAAVLNLCSLPSPISSALWIKALGCTVPHAFRCILWYSSRALSTAPAFDIAMMSEL